MKIIFLYILFLLTVSEVNAQLSDCPKVQLSISLPKVAFLSNEDIPVTMTLTNNTDSVQNVWFDKHKAATGGPAWTSVLLINKKTGKSVLKYGNKAILESQIYTDEEIEKTLTRLKPKEKVSSSCSLYDLVVIESSNLKLYKGTYEMQVFYCENASETIIFTVR